MFLQGFIFFSFVFFVVSCGGMLAFQDISKIEVYEQKNRPPRPYRVLGEVKATECDNGWVRFATYDPGPSESQEEATKTLKQLAKAKYGDECEAIVNVQYYPYKERKPARCPYGGVGDCSFSRWCVQARGQAVQWAR